MKRKARGGWFATILFTIISIFYVAPLLIVLINSFKEALIKCVCGALRIFCHSFVAIS